MSNVELKLIGITFGYDENKKLFDGFSITVRAGQLLLIRGPNGSGKSTLLKLMAGLLKPQFGSVLLNGTPLKREDFKKIGYVMQRAEDQFFCETVFEEIAFSARNFGFDDVEVRVKEAISAVGLTDKILEKSPFQLSEGEARRVAIACALVHKPDLLLLDEPLIGLDRMGKESVLEILKAQKGCGKAIVVTTQRSNVFHDLSDIVVEL
ncbi:ABC transporter ATP-binding protein [Pseudothermotoga sp.]|uniref:energy-coupling factor ABC transporter ATP-binding protein n=1 Tax=Pseudothermotoga sp. TaxID=2033661 RepID=UPI0031F6116F